MGTIKQGGWSYTLTPEDKLWAARMVEGEGGADDAPSVLWTMTQLFAPAGQRIKYGRPDRFRSFSDLIRAYSQPINPKWQRDGEFCASGGRHSSRDSCSETRLARRDRISTMPMSGISSGKRVVVDRWFSGSLTNPVPNAIEFADPSVSRSFLRRNPGWSHVTGGGNWFLRPPTSLPRVSMGGIGLGVVLLGVAGLGAGWLWWRRRR